MQEFSHKSFFVPVGVRFVFDASDDCTIVHSALYSCLRAVFGLSVAGVLVAVFSCMLVYQLLSHERKKMYWEQLELRCRSIYAPPPPQAQPLPPPMPSTAAVIETSRNAACRCCEQCHSHRAIIQPTYPWDGDNRFWTPAPGLRGNFYSPNPGSDDPMLASRVQPAQHGMRAQRPGWSWPRLPWQRSGDAPTQRFRQTPSSPDSQYGFSNNSSRMDNPAMIQAQSGYTLINGPIQHYGVWGPPPPYSDPNSPARRGRHPYGLTNPCQQIIEHSTVQTHQVQAPIHQNLAVMECHQRTASMDHLVDHHIEVNSGGVQSQTLHRYKKPSGFKVKESHDSSLASDSDNNQRTLTHSNTLPFRKAKKRNDVTTKSVGPHQPASRPNIQYVFNGAQNADGDSGIAAGCSNSSNNGQYPNPKRRKNGVDNTAFNALEDGKPSFEIAESEVYFGDVSSCCNNSTKNENFYDENGRSAKRSADDANEFAMQRYAKAEQNASSSMSNRLGFGSKPDYMKLTTSTETAKNNSRSSNRQSMCSMDSGEKTDFTDLSPLTPTTPYAMSDAKTSTATITTVATTHQRIAPLSHQYGNLAAVFNDILEPNESAYHTSRESRPRIQTKHYSEVHLDAEIPVDIGGKDAMNRSMKSGSANSSLNNSMRSYHSGKTRSTATVTVAAAAATTAVAQTESSPFNAGHKFNANTSSRNSRNNSLKLKSNAMHNGCVVNDVDDIDLMYLDANSNDSPENSETSEQEVTAANNTNEWTEKNIGSSGGGDRRL